MSIPHIGYRPLVTLLALLLVTACSEKPPQLAPLAADAVILAFGDSITYGTGAGRNQNYPAILEQLTGRTVINAGIPGEVSAAGATRIIEVLDEHEPDLLILCHGGNDMLRKKNGQQMLGNLRSMIRAAQARGVEVLLIGVPRPALFLDSADGYGQLAQELTIPVENEIIADILSDNKLKSDAIHPNHKGYRKLAEAVHALLRDSGAL